MPPPIHISGSHPDASRLTSHRPSLEDIVDVAKLQAIQDTFASAMGVAAVTVNRDGVAITRESNFQPLCKLIRATPKGADLCRACDASGGLSALKSGRPAIYACAFGLVDAAAPIILEGDYLGCILCGQVLIKEEQDNAIDEIINRATALGLDRAVVTGPACVLPVIPRERFDSAVNMLMHSASHFAEIGMTNLIQRRLLAEGREKAAIETALRDAQLQALQARMNPHFLFNALTLISYTALAESAPRTEEIAYTLADMLRYSLRNTAANVPLKEEFEMVACCLSLHHLRFGSKLVTRVELEPDLSDVAVPCMFLQPLVENAIVHGVESLTRETTVEVSGKARGGRVFVEVSDNGIGMSPEQVRSLNETRRPQPDSRRRRPALGLQTVLTRLENEYGAELDLEVCSSAARGTRLRLSWPLARAIA